MPKLEWKQVNDECWIGRDAEGRNVAEITWSRFGYVVDVTEYTYRTLRAAKLAAARRLW